jgi:hypothetical protein
MPRLSVSVHVLVTSQAFVDAYSLLAVRHCTGIAARESYPRFSLSTRTSMRCRAFLPDRDP